jgi:hypothetical protein
VLRLLPEIRRRMDLGLQGAYDLLRGPNGARSERLDWATTATAFRRHKVDDAAEARPPRSRGGTSRS